MVPFQECAGRAGGRVAGGTVAKVRGRVVAQGWRERREVGLADTSAVCSTAVARVGTGAKAGYAGDALGSGAVSAGLVVLLRWLVGVGEIRDGLAQELSECLIELVVVVADGGCD